ncbi:MAG: 50S ribosomal protein L9 [Clostridia bacterium]
MKILLLEDVKKLGKKGEIMEVSDGYAKNYIIPKKLGKEATKEVINEWSIKSKPEKEREAEEAKALAETLSKTVVVIKTKSGEGGRLFGSITSKDIAEALLKMDLNVDKKKIFVKDPIKAIGNYSVEVKLHANAAANLTVRIEEA